MFPLQDVQPVHRGINASVVREGYLRASDGLRKVVMMSMRLMLSAVFLLMIAGPAGAQVGADLNIS
ncbi:MAG: hypothetical protein EON85_01085, partial [Brevundimonas sp.]